jgi:putative dehydrogenase
MGEVVGLGAMGMGKAKSLRRAGYTVHAFDVRREIAEAFAAEGGAACDSPARSGRGLRSGGQRGGELRADGGGLIRRTRRTRGHEGGKRLRDVFYPRPRWSMALEKRLAEKGILYLDASISGGAAKAARGEITMMTSGHPDAYARVGPFGCPPNCQISRERSP